MQQHVGILTLPSEKDFSGSLSMYVQHARVLFYVQHVHFLCKNSLKRISGHASARIPEYLATFRNFWWQTSRILRQKYFWTKEKGFAIPQAVGGPTSQSIVQLGALPLYWVLHELLQGYRINCLLQLMDFSPSFFRVIANIRGKTHRRCGLYSVDWKECQPRHIKYFPCKITIELLKCLTSQVGFAAMTFCSA